GPVALEAAVLELDAGRRRPLCHEANLDLARPRLVGVVLPARPEVPAEDDALGRLPLDHAAPLAFGAVGGALVPASARAGLDHHLLRRLLADVVRIEQPPGGHALGEDREGALLRRLD